ncbi:MAG: hypothetical protein AAB730_00085, partial [Patescibacteria group bacterium]
MARKQKINVLRINKPSEIYLPRGIEVFVGVWKDKKGHKHASSYTRLGNTNVGIEDDGFLKINWDLRKKYLGVKYTAIRLPKDITAVFFD